MFSFKKRQNDTKVKKIPEGFSAEDIRIESSICTGERTIGFYDKSEKRLVYSELVTNETDIKSFYEKYGCRTKL